MEALGESVLHEWDVTLPERGARSFAAPAPRARIKIVSSAHGTEELGLPVVVGKRLLAAKKSGELCPSSRNELLHHVKELSRTCGWARVEDLVNRRDYSFKELVEKLRHDGYGQNVSESLARRACETGIVSDERYAGSFIRSKILAGWGRTKIERELSRRGIEASDVPGWPHEFITDDEERGRALDLAMRRRLTGKNDFQKLVRFLVARGFAPQLCYDVAREVLAGVE